ncbi:hypothetical protein KDD93_01485 [Campylobacter sp. faydin G-24]|uniref:Uncharacterized protein n=1 Tax=Campylobacter anatolicus TaxID=2829105 RepID=A0ABS5HG78_9BACT|nr:hypothetical protein [Campylobacter anatolicus]MBR8462299.1 hypothetical protein [Campylobacter anatolicus]MBR8463248.1 hypothetical protein [Campylobacter anatolicus]MBR8465438.1 hypothetical protein [Campylobacter anatolicus]
MKKVLDFIFSWGFFAFAIILGIALWFLIDYIDQFRLEATWIDISEIFAMAAVFGIVFYLIAAIFIMPIRKIYHKKEHNLK